METASVTPLNFYLLTTLNLLQNFKQKQNSFIVKLFYLQNPKFPFHHAIDHSRHHFHSRPAI